jgi:hypothetical protein
MPTLSAVAHTVQAQEGWLSDVVPCSQDCGEVYCSEACRQSHWRTAHSSLCVGAIPDDIHGRNHPLVLFRAHAARTNEIFLLVAEVVAAILARIRQGGESRSQFFLTVPFAVLLTVLSTVLSEQFSSADSDLCAVVPVVLAVCDPMHSTSTLHHT